jgi:hypothetical protein
VLKYLVRDVCLFHVKELAHLSQRVRPGINMVDGSLPNFWLIGAAGTLVYFGQWWVIIVWYLGTAMVFWPTFRLRIWTEHVGTDEAHRITAPWYIRFWLLPHNTFCHYEHHYYPQVPCWNLLKLRRMMGNVPEVIPISAIFPKLEQAPRIHSGEPMPSLQKTLPALSPTALD